MDAMNGAPPRAHRGFRFRCGLGAIAACALAVPAYAAGPGANVESLGFAEPAPAASSGPAGKAPWLYPIQRDTPIGSISALRAEYQRIRDERRAQLEPEYERRLAEDGRASANAWRDDTLRDVVRRDRRDLRARVSR